ncbi:MAG: rod shape-determining protein MreC [Patescibacteria group bacterium]
MKMSYRQNHTSRGKKFAFAFFIAALIAVFYFAGDTLARGASGAVHRLSVPIWRAGNYIDSTANIFSSALFSKQALFEENERLRSEIETLSVRLLSTDMLAAENKELKEIVGRDESMEVVLGTVLSRPPSSPYDTFIIDLGVEKVRAGDMVSAHGIIPVGTIAHARDNSSVVELFSSPGRKIDVLIGTENIATVAKGKGNGNFEMTLPRDTEVREGDIVVAPSITIEIFAVVGDIEKDSNSPFQVVRFSSPFNINNIRWVEVVVSHGKIEQNAHGTSTQDRQ